MALKSILSSLTWIRIHPFQLEPTSKLWDSFWRPVKYYRNWTGISVQRNRDDVIPGCWRVGCWRWECGSWRQRQRQRRRPTMRWPRRPTSCCGWPSVCWRPRGPCDGAGWKGRGRRRRGSPRGRAPPATSPSGCAAGARVLSDGVLHAATSHQHRRKSRVYHHGGQTDIESNQNNNKKFTIIELVSVWSQRKMALNYQLFFIFFCSFWGAVSGFDPEMARGPVWRHWSSFLSMNRGPFDPFLDQIWTWALSLRITPFGSYNDDKLVWKWYLVMFHCVWWCFGGGGPRPVD